MKVLHVISSGGLYGAEAVILDLCRSLPRRGHASLIANFANLAHPNTQLEQRAKLEGVELVSLPCRGQLDRTVPGRLRALVREQGVNLVHAHGYKADVYALWALKGAGVPLVSTCHTWYDNTVALRVYGIIDRRVLRRFEAVVAVSEAVRGQLLRAGVSRERVRLIRNGVDERPFAGVSRRFAPGTPEQPLRVGLVGRLAREKGVDLFVEAAALVLGRVPGASFSVFGEGPDRAALQQLIGQKGLSGRVVLEGRREEMPAVYAGLDLLVSASRQEGLPIALLEGMASGLPVVAARAGEVPSVVEEGVTGLLVPVEDVRALAGAIVELLVNPERRQKMSEAARLRVAQQFSGKRMAAEYLALYGEVLRSPAG